MNISDLIKRLEEIRNIHGDLEVYHLNNYDNFESDVTEIVGVEHVPSEGPYYEDEEDEHPEYVLLK